ncbi:mitochondrial carrier domain-containing protein, partial [Mycena crocata]
FSGAIGSASANALTYPLDVVTTRLQLDPPEKARKSSGLRGAVRILRGIIKKHGFQDLYNGLLTDTGATLLSNLLEEVLLGFIAGVASRAVSTPLNIVTLRLQIENENDEEESGVELPSAGVGGVVNKIYKEEGILGFWRGFKTTTLLSLNPALTLALFQVFRRVLARASETTGADPKPSQASSARPSASFLYPLMLAKTRLQASSATSMQEVLRDAYTGKGRSTKRLPRREPNSKTPGIPGLYQGLEMQILKGFLSQGVTFLVKGRVEQLIVEMYSRRSR